MIDAVIRHCSRLTPYAVALATGEGDISFQRLDADVGSVAAHLRARFGPMVRAARIEIANPALAWVAAAAAQRIGWTVGFARPGAPAFRTTDGEATVVLSDAPGAPQPGVTPLDPAWLTPPAAGQLERPWDAPGVAAQHFASKDGGGDASLRLCAEDVEERVGQVDWLLPRGGRMACLIGPQSPLGLAVVLRQWLAGGCLVTPTAKAPLGGLGPERRLDLLVLRPSQLAGLLEAMPPDAAPRPGLRLVVVGGRVPRALTLAAHLRLAAEVVLVHATDAQGLIAMGVDTVARSDGEVGPLAPWLDARAVTLAAGVHLGEDGVLSVQDAVAA